MEFLLISAALNLKIIYADESLCQMALERVRYQDDSAICIPAGKNKTEDMFENFLNMMEKIQRLEFEATQQEIK